MVQDRILLWTTNRKWYMVYRIAAVWMNLSGIQGHFTYCSLFKWNLCTHAAVDKISTDIARGAVPLRLLSLVITSDNVARSVLRVCRSLAFLGCKNIIIPEEEWQRTLHTVHNDNIIWCCYNVLQWSPCILHNVENSGLKMITFCRQMQPWSEFADRRFVRFCPLQVHSRIYYYDVR